MKTSTQNGATLPATHGSRSSELEAKKTELIDEKSENIQKLSEINAVLKTVHPRDRGTPANNEMLKERSELVQDNAEIDVELRRISQELRELNGSKDGGRSDMNHIVQLVCARIASGNADPVEMLTAEAMDDIERIKAAVRNLSENVRPLATPPLTPQDDASLIR